MTKFFLGLVLIAVLVCPAAAFSQDDLHKALFTDKFLNGRFLVGLSDEAATVFVQGAIDGVGKMSPGTLSKIYPGLTREDVVIAVKGYYVSNADKLDRPVVDVLMSGCK